MGATNPLDTEVRHVGAAGEAVTTSLRQLDLSGSGLSSSRGASLPGGRHPLLGVDRSGRRRLLV